MHAGKSNTVGVGRIFMGTLSGYHPSMETVKGGQKGRTFVS